MKGARVDVLNKILYDDSLVPRRAVLTDMSDPLVAVALGWARCAMLLQIFLDAGRVDRFGNEWSMRMAIRNLYRTEECARNGTSPVRWSV